METGMNRHLALLMLAGLAACGGGGGSASSDPAPDPDAPTFAFNAAYRSPDELSKQIMATGSFMLQLAQFTIDTAQRFAVPGSAGSVSANCAYTGSVDLQFDDRDNSGGPSAGDSITVTLRNCGVPILARTATGTLRVDIRAVSTAGVEAEVQARMTVLDALQLTAFGPNNTSGVSPLGTLHGSMAARWSSDGLTEELRALSTPEDDLRLNALHDGVESVDSMRRIDVSRSTRLDAATVGSSMAYVLDVGARGGHLRVRQAVPFVSDLNALPRAGRVEADLAANELLQIQKVVRQGTFHLIEWVWSQRPSGYVLFRNDMAWDDGYGMLTYDVRVLSGVGLPLSVSGTTDLGGGYGVAAPWQGVLANSAIDRACAQISAAGVSAYTRADALFQRPVVPVPGATSEGSVYRLQFGRALAVNTPALQFRFRDAQETPEPDFPYWNVAATAVRRGAMYEVRPAEALRHGRTYYLESSLDGTDWNGERNFYDTSGQLMSIGGSTLAVVYTDDLLRVELAPGDLVVPSVTKPARLTPVVTARDGQAIASYRWEQLSGSPINFSAPESAVTEVSYAAGPRDVAPVLLQLTVTDVQGARQRLRAVLTVGDRAPGGALFYRRLSDSSDYRKRSLQTGTGSVVEDATSGQMLLRTPAAGELPLFANMALRSADGSPLQVGVYDNAVYTPAAGVQPGMSLHVYCLDLAAVRGRFQVLELVRGSDGSVQRMAVDFDQRCMLTGGESAIGSYRFNSTLPFTP